MREIMYKELVSPEVTARELQAKYGVDDIMDLYVQCYDVNPINTIVKEENEKRGRAW